MSTTIRSYFIVAGIASSLLVASSAMAQGRPPRGTAPAPSFTGTSTGTTSGTNNAPPTQPVLIPASRVNAGANAGNLSLTTNSAPRPLAVTSPAPTTTTVSTPITR